MRHLMLLLVSILVSVPALALDEPVGRIVTVVKTAGAIAEVDLKVENYSFFADSPVEILTPAGKMAATLRLPSGIDMMRKGEQAKVTLQMRGPFVLAGALVTEPGKFANHAALVKALGGTAPAPVVAATAASAPPATAVKACPYTAAELKAALGLDLKEGAPGMELPFAGGRLLDCRYNGKDGKTPALWLKQTVMDKPSAADANYLKSLAGTLEKIPNDPDGAVFQGGQGDNTNAVLVYQRKGVTVEARVRVGPKDASFAAIKQKLAKLRRVP